jgi:hypothetical protein
MFLLWDRSFQRETIFAFAKIARRVYAVFLPNAMEKKVPTPVNPALRKPFRWTCALLLRSGAKVQSKAQCHKRISWVNDLRLDNMEAGDKPPSKYTLPGAPTPPRTGTIDDLGS